MDIIVEVVGGLGNQIFQYAFYKSIKRRYPHANCYLYLGRFSKVKDNKGFQLDKVFNNIDYMEFKEDPSYLIDNRNGFFSKCKIKLFGRKRSFIVENSRVFDSKYFLLPNIDRIYLSGLWQTKKYFHSVKDLLRSELTFSKESIDPFMLKAAGRISVHVRRGDYVNNPQYYKILGDICDYDYYKNAISLIRKKLNKNKLCLYVFSDDVDWVKKNYSFFSDHDVIFSENKTDLEDLVAMSLCDHNIIANSTFSWWAAWLNNNSEKIVVAPSKWYKNIDSDIVPDEWNKV